MSKFLTLQNMLRQTFGESSKPKTVAEFKKSEALLKGSFDALKFTDEDTQALANAYYNGGYYRLFGRMLAMRPDVDETTFANAVCYLIIKSDISEKVLGEPVTGVCTVCKFRDICRKPIDKPDAKCGTFLHKDCRHYKVIDSKLHYIVYDHGVIAEGSRRSIRKDRRIHPETRVFDWVKEHCDADGRIMTVITKAVPSLLLWGVRPQKGESYSKYTKRVEAVVASIIAEITPTETDKETPPEEAIKMIFIQLGHEDMLKTMFGNDPLKMAAAFFPGKTPSAIIKQFSSKPVAPKVTPHLVYEKLKQEKTNAS